MVIKFIESYFDNEFEVIRKWMSEDRSVFVYVARYSDYYEVSVAVGEDSYVVPVSSYLHTLQVYDLIKRFIACNYDSVVCDFALAKMLLFKALNDVL